LITSGAKMFDYKEFLNLFILELCKHILWSIVVLIMVYVFKDSVNSILNAIALMMNRVEKVDFKDLSLILSNEKVPIESKVLLTEYFIGQQKQDKLAVLLNVVTSLRSVLIFTKNSTGKNKEAIIQPAIDALEKLRDGLKEIAPEKAAIIQDVIDKLRERPRELRQTAFSVVEALQLLDPDYYEKDPSKFQQLIEIRNIIMDV
jgi:hypothetical protein